MRVPLSPFLPANPFLVTIAESFLEHHCPSSWCQLVILHLIPLGRTVFILLARWTLLSALSKAMLESPSLPRGMTRAAFDQALVALFKSAYSVVPFAAQEELSHLFVCEIFIFCLNPEPTLS